MSTSNNRRGFTLIELLIVIAIIGLLAGIILVSLGGARQSARVARVQSDTKQLITAIQILENDTGQWPEHQVPWSVNTGVNNEVWNLGASDAGITQDDLLLPYVGWNGPYIAFAPVDPWGNPYFLDTDYSVQENEINVPCGVPPVPPCVNAVVIGSFGPNGAGQNDYDSDDVIREMSR